MKVFCVFSLESPHPGDSNVYTQYTIFIIKKKITPDDSKSAAMEFFSYGLKNEFETALVNEPSVFEPPKFYCTRYDSCTIRSNEPQHNKTRALHADTNA